MKVGEDEWREREEGHEILRERRGKKRFELRSLIYQMIKVEKCTHKAYKCQISVVFGIKLLALILRL